MGKPLELPALAAGKDEELDAAGVLALETDRLARAYAARATLGISPAALVLAFADWWLHLAASPGKLVDLADTIKGFQGLCEGKYDHLPEAAFYMVGTIEEAVEKGKKLAAEAA